MRILIIGKGSYIGTHIKETLMSLNHEVTEFDSEKEEISDSIFENIDSVICVAAIVHRKDIVDYDVYKRVNVELPIKAATYARNSGVKQFIFFSSMAVYGKKKSYKNFVIDEKTPLRPKTLYGRSKLEAEQALVELENEKFSICILRPANVYGKGCRGSYISKFKSITKKLPAIPYAFKKTKQGLIYIENLCELVRLVVENRASGVFVAQDKNSVSTVEIISAISNAMGVKRKNSKLLGLIVKIFRFGPVKKLYGGIAYHEEYAKTELGDYCKVAFVEAMLKTCENKVE